ncbi:hypothetical protein ACFQZT_10305 [Paenibacillus sp. GCM10027628]|uniref:hypothetical protein n=1 Tax=Paenibacillus sp. GCM10027628 TaxID=3273413 RepID=UPI003637325C
MTQTIGMKVIKRLGYAASVLTVVLWIIFVWINPYAAGMNRSSTVITFAMLVLPAVVCMSGLFLARSSLILAAFIWGLPYSLYMLLTPSIFLLFGITNFMYLLCFIGFRANKVKY